MNVAVALPQQGRRAASPYARRLARERAFDLLDLVGSGPDGRIVAADIRAYRVPVAEIVPEAVVQVPVPTARTAVVTFSATVSLANLYRLIADTALVGLEIAVEDVAVRAAAAVLSESPEATTGDLAVETDGRQIINSTTSGLSISAERRLRQQAVAAGSDASSQPAAASLFVLHSARVVPVSLPLLPNRAFRFALVVDNANQRGYALLTADTDAATETQAAALLEAFTDALERPLALLA